MQQTKQIEEKKNFKNILKTKVLLCGTKKHL